MTESSTIFGTPRRIKLLGELGRRFGRIHRLAVDSPAEAIRALCVMVPGFLQYMADGDGAKMPFRVMVAGQPIQNYDAELHMQHGQQADYVIAPAIAGGKSAWGSIIIGAGLIAGAVLLGPAGWGALSASATAAIGTSAAYAAYAAASVGTLMVLGGVTRLLTPMPKADAGKSNEGRASYLFNGPVNTTQQGAPVPVGYGRLIVGSAVISGGITVDDI